MKLSANIRQTHYERMGGHKACPSGNQARANIVARPHNAGSVSWQGFQISVEGGSEVVALPATDVSGGELDAKSIRRLGKPFEAGCGPEEGGVEGKSGA